MEFLPQDIENIIIDYKNQFERKYSCSIKHKHGLFETRKKTGIIFYKNPYIFECKICKMKICNEHSEDFLKKNTKNDLCASCHLAEVQVVKILKDIKYEDKNLINYIKFHKSMLFLFKDEDLVKVNKKLIEKMNGKNTISDTDLLYKAINDVYSELQIFNFNEV